MFANLAIQEGLRSRSAYKLDEINNRFGKFLRTVRSFFSLRMLIRSRKKFNAYVLTVYFLRGDALVRRVLPLSILALHQVGFQLLQRNIFILISSLINGIILRLEHHGFPHLL